MRYAARIVTFFALIAGCAKPPAARPEPPPAPVTVAAASVKTMPLRVRTIGTAKAIATVAIRPRVGGQITEVFFNEGDFVEENQKLFTIDPRPYEAAVKMAEANKAKNAAVLKGAELELQRIDRLRKTGGGSATDFDAAATAVATATAAIEVDKAAIHSATIQHSFTTIRAPIAGRVGESLIDRGNLVDANGLSPLVVINQISPIHVAFTLPEQQLPAVLAARKKGPLRVEAELRGSGPVAVGELAFVDNTADPLTGTVQYKAEFTNADQRLWPGLFLGIVLTLGDRHNSVVVPAAAIQSGQQGQYVYVVTPEKTAELRPVVVAFEDAGESVIASGLKGGESVVVEGQLRLAPGVKVDVKGGKDKSAAPPVPPVSAEGGK
ncbi:MAG TPA: efflux RND transporter periplasmic adaptor subunit [Gemmataceae bacterium]|nr:efflux RND transporter periplasmic adaptor subunit [Gemmataceae bacterium]